MCKGTTAGEGGLILRKDFHPSIQHLYTKDIAVDACIAYEMSELLAKGVATFGMSCCGHGKQQSQAWLFESSVDKAIELGYRVFTAYTQCGEPSPAIMLMTGTQSDVLLYDGYIHGDDEGKMDGVKPPPTAHKPTRGWRGRFYNEHQIL